MFSRLTERFALLGTAPQLKTRDALPAADLLVDIDHRDITGVKDGSTRALAVQTYLSPCALVDGLGWSTGPASPSRRNTEQALARVPGSERADVARCLGILHSSGLECTLPGALTQVLAGIQTPERGELCQLLQHAKWPNQVVVEVLKALTDIAPERRMYVAELVSLLPVSNRLGHATRAMGRSTTRDVDNAIRFMDSFVRLGLPSRDRAPAKPADIIEIVCDVPRAERVALFRACAPSYRSDFLRALSEIAPEKRQQAGALLHAAKLSSTAPVASGLLVACATALADLPEAHARLVIELISQGGTKKVSTSGLALTAALFSHVAAEDLHAWLTKAVKSDTQASAEQDDIDLILLRSAVQDGGSGGSRRPSDELLKAILMFFPLDMFVNTMHDTAELREMVAATHFLLRAHLPLRQIEFMLKATPAHLRVAQVCGLASMLRQIPADALRREHVLRLAALAPEARQAELETMVMQAGSRVHNGRDPENVMDAVKQKATCESVERLAALHAEVDAVASFAQVVPWLETQLAYAKGFSPQARRRTREIRDALMAVDGPLRRADMGGPVSANAAIYLNRRLLGVGMADLCGLVWHSISHYQHPTGDAGLTRQDRDNLHYSFIKQLANCIEHEQRGRRVCGVGQAERIISVLEGYLDEIHADIVSPEQLLCACTQAFDISLQDEAPSQEQLEAFVTETLAKADERFEHNPVILARFEQELRKYIAVQY